MNVSTHRQCSIELVNKSRVYTLCSPSVFVNSGSCETPLPPTLSPCEAGAALFVKTRHALHGSVGVLTYDLLNGSAQTSEGKMAVMFSVPYDFNLFSNWFAVGVFEMTAACDRSLYEEMYYRAERGFVRGRAKESSLTYRGAAVTIRATMSDSYTPVVKVQVCNN